MNQTYMDERTATGIMAMGAGMMVFILILVVLMIVSLWKIFTKAGKPGWAAIVPIYNAIVYLQIIRRPGWWILIYIGIMIIYYAGIGMTMNAMMNGGSGGGGGSLLVMLGGLALLVVSIMDTHRLSTSFGQGAGFTVGLILLGIIFYPILAFGDSKYMSQGNANNTGALDQGL